MAARRKGGAVHDSRKGRRPRCGTGGGPGFGKPGRAECSSAAAVTPTTCRATWFAKRVERRDAGHLVYATAGTLRAVRFDLERLETLGTPVAVVQDVVTTANGDMNAVVAEDGTLVYVPGPASSDTGRQTHVGGPARRRDARSPRRRAATSNRGCHPTANASQCSPPIRSWTSGFPISARLSLASPPVPVPIALRCGRPMAID